MKEIVVQCYYMKSTKKTPVDATYDISIKNNPLLTQTYRSYQSLYLAIKASANNQLNTN
ncbi:Uncharacterised protein [Yersinia frederiksenii]|nr:Uncharacterised protein [Yersinia frederiksenii]